MKNRIEKGEGRLKVEEANIGERQLIGKGNGEEGKKAVKENEWRRNEEEGERNREKQAKNAMQQGMKKGRNNKRKVEGTKIRMTREKEKKV